MNPSIHAKHVECNYFPLPSKFEMTTQHTTYNKVVFLKL
jgi:hypothetical protein